MRWLKTAIVILGFGVALLSCLFTLWVSTQVDMSKCRYIARTMPLWCEK